MEFAKLRKKAILGVPLPIVAILALTISAAVALFIIEQRFAVTVSVTETPNLVVVYEEDGSTPIVSPIVFTIDVPSDVIETIEHEFVKVFVIENTYVGSIDLAVWSYLDGLNETIFSYTIDATRDDLVYWPDITDPTVRVPGGGAGSTLGLETTHLFAECTLTIVVIDPVALDGLTFEFDLVVLAEQVEDWVGWS